MPLMDASALISPVYVPQAAVDGTVKLTFHDFVSGPPPVEKLRLAGDVETQLSGIGLPPVPVGKTVAVKFPLPPGAVTLCEKEMAGPPAVALRVWLLGE
jgi:hypothetical protein